MNTTLPSLRTSILAAGLIFCSGLTAQTPTVSGDDMLCPDGLGTVTTQTFDSYQWLRRYYGTTVTNPIPGATDQSLEMNYYDYAACYLSVATTLGGVPDTSAEFFVDGWVFGSPYVISDGDFTIGTSGESILCPGASMYFEFSSPYTANITWYKDGNPIPGETSPTLTVTQPGVYYVEGAPGVCPDFIQGPGVTMDVVVLSFSPVSVLTSGDFTTGTGGELELCPGADGFFDLESPYDTDITWYLNGTPLPGETNTQLEVTAGGTYTVSAAPADCPAYIQYFAGSLVVDMPSFGVPAVTVSGDHTVVGGNYFLCETGDAVILEIENPYNTNITWFESGTPISGATAQTLTITAPGTYTASASPAECPDYIQPIPDSYIVYNCVVGLTEDAAAELSVYPNPANQYVNISISQELIGTFYELQDQTGRVVVSGQLQNTVTTIETENLSNGIYVLRVGGKTAKLVAVENN